jgi:hypothetical protein
MIWTEPKPPTEGVSFYDYVDCETPLGKIRIEWKNWEESPSYDVELDSIWIGCEYSLEDAKIIGENYILSMFEKLKEYLSTPICGCH